MSNCSICNLNPVKYTCPACGTKTCSFPCVKKHKEEKNCSGAVDLTKFLPRSELASSDVQVNRDYNFLMKVGRHITLGKDDIKANAKNVFKRQFHNNNNNNPNKRVKPNEVVDPRKYLVDKCFPNSPPTMTRRNNTLVIQLPLGMSRALSNKTGFDKKIGSYIWTVEWVFIDVTGEEITRFLSYRLKETVMLRDSVPLNIINKSLSEKSPEKGETIEKGELFFYLENILDKRKTQGKSIIKLSPDVLVSEALTDKVVLEYPTIYVTRNEDTWKSYITEQLDDDSDSSEAESSEDDSSSEVSSSSDDDSSEDESDDDEAPEVSSSKQIIEKKEEENVSEVVPEGPEDPDALNTLGALKASNAPEGPDFPAIPDEE